MKRMERVLLSDSYFVSLAKVLFSFFNLGFLGYLIFFNPKDFMIWFLLILINGILFLKVKIQRFKNVSFDNKYIYINTKRFELSNVDLIRLGYFNKSYVKINSKKYYFSLPISEISKRENIDRLKENIDASKIEMVEVETSKLYTSLICSLISLLLIQLA